MVFLDVTKGLNKIGRLGENNHRTFRFGETCEALAMYPDANVAVLHRRPGDAAAYPVAPGFVQIVDGAVCWTVMSGDLARKGRGKVEVVILDGTTVAKTYIYDTYIDDALDGSGEPPEPLATYLAQIIAAGEHAPQVLNGTWWVWSTSAQAYADTEVPAQGEDGRGIAGTTLLANYCLRITFTDGTSVDVGPIRGEPGQDYVITSEDYDAIAAEVATRQAIQGKVDAATDAADLSRGYADGKHLNGTVNPLLSENNGEYWAGQAAVSAEEAAETAEMLGDVALDSTAQEFVRLVDDNSILTGEMFDLMIEMLPGDEAGQLILQDLVDENSNLDLLVRELLEREATA